jgi:hypothetical protein
LRGFASHAPVTRRRARSWRTVAMSAPGSPRCRAVRLSETRATASVSHASGRRLSTSGRTARAAAATAVTPHPPPARLPAVTHPRWLRCKSPRAVLPRRAILSPRKLPVKGAAACGLRVPCFARADP